MYIRNLLCLLFCVLFCLTGCRKDDLIDSSEDNVKPTQPSSKVKGFYLLNEGNMNMNKSSLDYYDYSSGIYKLNIYGSANPDAVKGLGDVGNDLGVYGSKLYAVINNSNKVEIMDVSTSKRLKVVDIKNCRYVTFGNGKAYVSAYDGEIGIGSSSVNGFVVEIDTLSMQITRKVEVGRQPEQMAIVNNRLYVANSGGYSPPNYERTVSVIDLNSFERIRDIDVAINLHRLRADSYGDLYVSSRGDYYDVPSKLFVIDTKNNSVKKEFDIACSNITIVGDTAYIIGSEFSYTTGDWQKDYTMIDVKQEKVLDGSYIPKSVEDQIKMPYCIAVDPISRYKYISDAGDYVSPGKLYCLDTKNNIVFSTTTGDIPSSIAFIKGH